MTDKQHMNIVVAGHVDHGKSTVIGRLLADTHSLPDGKIEQIREMCRRNSKPFEYAFLLDALEDEREKTILILRYGLYGNEAHTQRMVAKKLGISRSYVSRLEKKSLATLRKKFQ